MEDSAWTASQEPAGNIADIVVRPQWGKRPVKMGGEVTGRCPCDVLCWIRSRACARIIHAAIRCFSHWSCLLHECWVDFIGC